MKKKATFKMKYVKYAERVRIKNKAVEFGGTAYMVNGVFIVEVPRAFELQMFKFLSGEGLSDAGIYGLILIITMAFISLIMIANWYLNLNLFAN